MRRLRTENLIHTPRSWAGGILQPLSKISPGSEEINRDPFLQWSAAWFYNWLRGEGRRTAITISFYSWTVVWNHENFID